jgi:hypothetical protein
MQAGMNFLPHFARQMVDAIEVDGWCNLLTGSGNSNINSTAVAIATL